MTVAPGPAPLTATPAASVTSRVPRVRGYTPAGTVTVPPVPSASASSMAARSEHFPVLSAQAPLPGVCWWVSEVVLTVNVGPGATTWGRSGRNGTGLAAPAATGPRAASGAARAPATTASAARLAGPRRR